MRKKLLTLVGASSAVLTIATTTNAYAYHTVSSYSQYLGQSVNTNGNYEGWYQFSDGSWGYYIENGKLVKNSELKFSDGTYAIGEDGKMVTGWFYADDGYYYFYASDGRAQKGWLSQDGLWYYFDNDCRMQTGWQLINQRWYYFDQETGVMASNVKVDGYYLSSDGSLQ